jgi:hypothetical protein
MMKKLFIVTLAIFLAACGAPVKRTEMGLENVTQIVVVAEKLVGSRVQVDDNLDVIVDKSMLDKYTMGVLGAADRAEENYQAISIKVDPGTHKLLVTSGGRIVIDKSIYVSEGQTTKVGK